jgi:hypothetical protein
MCIGRRERRRTLRIRAELAEERSTPFVIEELELDEPRHTRC